MGAHPIFFIIFTLFSCIILTNQSLPWYSLRSGFQCDTNMAAVFRPEVSKKFKGLKLLVTVTVNLRIEVKVSKMKSILKLILSQIS